MKTAFKHAQNARIHIIVRMRKVLFRSLLSIDTFYNIHWFRQRTVKALIRLRVCLRGPRKPRSLIRAFTVRSSSEGTFLLGGLAWLICKWLSEGVGNDTLVTKTKTFFFFFFFFFFFCFPPFFTVAVWKNHNCSRLNCELVIFWHFHFSIHFNWSFHIFSHLHAFCCSNTVSTQFFFFFFFFFFPDSAVHLEGDCTTRNSRTTCAYTAYIANEGEHTGKCGI